MSGKVYGLGIGPGDPELITLKALRLLRAAPVVAYPAPEQGESLVRSIVAQYLTEQQHEIPIRMPMLASRFPAQEVYDWAAQELGEQLQAGRDIAVLCEGDPFFYGSFMYLFGRLVERFPVEVIPGVSSLTACSAILGAPLAARNDVLTVLPAPLNQARLQALLSSTEAAAIIKLGRHFNKVREVLTELNLQNQAHYIERATLGEQRILRLDEVKTTEVPYFSMIVVHRRGAAWTL